MSIRVNINIDIDYFINIYNIFTTFYITNVKIHAGYLENMHIIFRLEFQE